MDEDIKIKGGIKKKKKDGLTADIIDNTAPVTKIIDEMEQINHQAYMFLNANRRPRYYYRDVMKKHFLQPGHQLAAFPEDWDGELSPDYFQPFRYHCMQPKMITAMANMFKQDPIAEYMKLKQKWSRDLLCLRNSNNQFRVPLIQRFKEHSDEVVSCPKHFVDMAKHLVEDPDIYFDSPYNWYYAGNGNLQLLLINYREYLMCSEFHRCSIFEFNNVELNFNNREAISVFDCGEGNNICESICSSQNIVALRTKYKIFVLKIISKDDNIELHKLKVSESEKPYTGISFDEFHKNILYVADLTNKLKIVNLDRLTARTVELKNSVKSLVNNWNTVVGVERGYYTHVAKNAITLYDKRMNDSVRRWSNPNRISDDACCNLICAAKHSPSRPYLYFATNHHLLLMDMRYQSNLTLKPLQRWTHGMQCFPTHISISKFEYDKELLCLSSQWVEDTCVVQNYLQTDHGEPEFKGITIPYRLPTILQTLNDARLQSLCTDVYVSIENRLVAALSGSLVFEHGEQYVVLTQNSLGDVSAHEFWPEHRAPLSEDDAPQALHEWGQDYRVEKKDFLMSGIKDIKHIWKLLEDVPEGEINKRYEHEKSDFNEQEVLDAFEKEELDAGLLDVWLDDEDTVLDNEDTVVDNDDGLSLNVTKDVD